MIKMKATTGGKYLYLRKSDSWDRFIFAITTATPAFVKKEKTERRDEMNEVYARLCFL